MALADLRAWIDRLEGDGELDRVKVEVDWNVEIGALARFIRERSGHAILFENVKDYQQARCRRVFTNFGRINQLAMALGLPKDSAPKEVVSWIRHGFKGRVPPVEVANAPVKQNIFHGDEVDLFDLPVPKWNAGDGGRYINTQCGVVTRDPDTGWLNIGLYRGMIVDRNHIPVLLIMTQHWGLHFAKYRERKQRMPVAVFYGGDPMLAFLAATPAAPAGVCEYDIVGVLRGEPVNVVKCETSDLLVPSDAEIVVEGFVDPDPSAFMLEGPFREYSGSYGGEAQLKPTIEVTCITHRDDAIYQGSVGGGMAFPGFKSVSVSAFAWNLLESAGVPGVTDVWCPPITAGKMAIVQIHKTYRGQAKQVAAALWGTTAAQDAFKHVIVVEEDINIHDKGQLDWAMTFRINAADNDIVVFPGTPGSPLDPAVPLAERDTVKYGCGKWARVLFDCTRNWEHAPLASPMTFEDKEENLPRPWEEYRI